MKKQRQISSLTTPALPKCDPAIGRYTAALANVIRDNINGIESVEYDPGARAFFVGTTHTAYVDLCEGSRVVATECSAVFVWAHELAPMDAMEKLVADVGRWCAALDSLDP